MSRSSIASDSHDRLEPRLLRAVEHDNLDALGAIVDLARENGQFSDNFLRIGLMRSCERGSIAAAQHLLSLGARTDVANNRLSPLLRAVERNHARIVQLLLDYGASPETTDKKGRSALMTAAWRNHWHVLQVLIARGADVNAKDLRNRNVLHNLAADKQCDWGRDVLDLLLATTCQLDGIAGQDELGRTPLHWACATGKLALAELLLTRPHCGGPIADVDAVETRNKTSLHLAIAHGHDDIIHLLLRHGADINARSDGGWTPLHNACDKGIEPIVRTLLHAGARINSQLLNGVTPLHLAAQAGHTSIVETLLERPDLKRRVRDNFGSTPFLRAAQFKRKDIVALLAPTNNISSLSPDARGACEAFDATVVDFGNFHNENRVQKTPVFNLLYGRDTDNPRKHAFSTLPANSKATDFRWIHLPANNMAWVEALLTKTFIEEGAHDVESFKGLEKSFRYQHHGQRTHSHFMRPLCQSSPRAMLRVREKADEEVPQTQNMTPKIHINGQLQDTSKEQKKSKKTSKNKPTDTPDDTQSKKFKRKQPPTPPNEKSLSLCKDTHSPSSNICLFMPYLHFETATGRQKMQDAIHRAETLTLTQNLTRQPTRDELLIRAHLASSTTSLHVRRTLDQFFYPNIDTQTRDQDQVVYRYQTQGQGRERYLAEPKIFMVDQLWMWILGTGLIVTSFAQRWEQPKNDPLNVLDGIIEDINSKTREPVKSVYDLAILISNRCSGVFDRHRMGDEEYQFLDMFEASIGSATDRETVLFNRFNRASAQASSWLKRSHRKLRRSRRSRADDADNSTLPDTDTDTSDSDSEPLFVDNLLDIGQETNLLSETKDIRDELNMIHTVLQHQQHVLDSLQTTITDLHTRNHRTQHDLKKRSKDQQATINLHMKDIDRMDKQASRIYASITDLLDLKQKHANAFEARFARDQAAGTVRQGRIIMMFTVVTIVFLPLSFIASVFTINISEFPHVGGQEELALGWVAKWVFGIGFAISIPLVLLALVVDDIGVGVRRVRRCLREVVRERRNKKRRRVSLDTGGGRGGEGGSEMSEIEMEKILTSGSKVRASFESRFVGGSLLPVSTRESRRRM